MRVVMFCHSLLSDWNHGNAHFLRGICTELVERGVDLRVYEPAAAWSIRNLEADHGDEPLAHFRRAYPTLNSIRFHPAELDFDEALDGADLVLVHEWSEPSLVKNIGVHHARSPGYVLLFHDTHHRSVTDPASMARYDLQHYDGVLAFGASIVDVYRREGWAQRVWAWHEAADTRRFCPVDRSKEGDLVWIGNWGDDERTAELQEFLFEPVKRLALRARVHGVRYPPQALAALKDAGIDYGGWVANFDVPELFARYRVTVHVPRRPYATALPGIPTIRIFEALACGIPLISAPWNDSEGLFSPGEDYLVAQNGEHMVEHLRALLHDREYAQALAAHGLATVLARHTCKHRTDELLNIYGEVSSAAAEVPVEGCAP